MAKPQTSTRIATTNNRVINDFNYNHNNLDKTTLSYYHLVHTNITTGVDVVRKLPRDTALFIIVKYLKMICALEAWEVRWEHGKFEIIDTGIPDYVLSMTFSPFWLAPDFTGCYKKLKQLGARFNSPHINDYSTASQRSLEIFIPRWFVEKITDDMLFEHAA